GGPAAEEHGVQPADERVLVIGVLDAVPTTEEARLLPWADHALGGEAVVDALAQLDPSAQAQDGVARRLLPVPSYGGEAALQGGLGDGRGVEQDDPGPVPLAGASQSATLQQVVERGRAEELEAVPAHRQDLLAAVRVEGGHHDVRECGHRPSSSSGTRSASRTPTSRRGLIGRPRRSTLILPVDSKTAQATSSRPRTPACRSAARSSALVTWAARRFSVRIWSPAMTTTAPALTTWLPRVVRRASPSRASSRKRQVSPITPAASDGGSPRIRRPA